MRPTVTTRMVLVLALVAVVVGLVDALVADQWDTAALFVVVGLLDGLLLVRLQTRRPPVPLRRDLVDWLRERAALTGEEPEAVADRAVAAYRSGLTGTRRTDDGD
jgi:hypothetical protein